MTLKHLAVFLCLLGVLTAAPRPVPSLEEYLPPHHAQNTAPNALKDYLPPLQSSPVIDLNINTAAEPCDCDEEPKGYFYPKPDKVFEIPLLRTLDQELPLEEVPSVENTPTTTEPPATTPGTDSERPARSARKSNLVTNPEDGPVRIRTLPFYIMKTDQQGRALKFRRDTSQRSQLSKVDAVVVRVAEKKPQTVQKSKSKVPV